MDERLLMEKALEARANAYCPYSGFAVGAALLGEDGKIYTGCNVESASYGATNCAERTAVFKAVSEGVRKFRAIAVVGGHAGEEPQELCPPCGICRQVLAEFVAADFPVLLGKNAHQYQKFSLGELLPLQFNI